MLLELTLIAAAGVGGLLAAYVLWWSAHRSGLWNLIAGALLGIAVVLLAVLIGYLMVSSTGPF